MAKKRTTRKKPVKRNAAITPAMVSAVMGGAVPPSMVQAVAKEYARVKNPSPDAFRKCVNAVAARSRRNAPGKRYKNVLRGKDHPKPARKNPVEEAAVRYEKFHGRGPEEIIEVTETIHEHSVLSGIGKLVELVIHAVDGRTEVTLKNFKGALLSMDEEATQLFIVGGDQSVNVADFGIDPKQKHEQEMLGACQIVAYETRKDHLGEGGGAGARAVHVHDFGSLRQVPADDPRRKRGSRLPIVLYNTRNKLLSFAGGNYDLPDVGIRG